MIRTGRKVGRTLYNQAGPEPSDRDNLIGMMDTPELAQMVVEAVNGDHEKLLRVRELAARWAALAPPDGWGESMDATVAADCGRGLLAILDGTNG